MLQTDRQFGRKTHSEQLGCCATHLRRHNSAPWQHHTARPTRHCVVGEKAGRPGLFLDPTLCFFCCCTKPPALLLQHGCAKAGPPGTCLT
eukprot:scaffold43963_cov60-Phaeocystis_antarctica.AAC.1